MTDVRANIVKWAKWFADNKHTHPFTYSEGSDRMSAIGEWPVKFPVTCDCSAFVTLCYWLSGAADPNGQNYDHEGYTGTLISHGHEVPAGNATAGDIVIYGPGTGEHTAVVVEGGRVPLTVSMGENGDPSYVTTTQDGRLPQRFFRFDTNAVGTIHEPGGSVVAVVKHAAPVVAPEVHEKAPEAPVAPAIHETVDHVPATGFPLIKGIESIVEAIIEGPKE